MISFVYSVPQKYKGVNLPDYPVQIIPYSRTRIIEAEIKCYPIRDKNNGGIVHASYLCHPFNKSFEHFENVNVLRTYKTLCERIKYNFLIHGPSNEKEFANFEKAMSIIRKLFRDFNQKVLIEVPSFNSSFRISMHDYLIRIVEEFPCDKNNFEICIDTAHLYANGCECEDIIKVCEEFSDVISTIHLNGNENAPWNNDKHIEIFSPNSKLKNIKEMMQYFKSKNFLMIAEVNRGTYGYSDWKAFADSYGIKIVDFSEKLIINNEKIL